MKNDCSHLPSQALMTHVCPLYQPPMAHPFSASALAMTMSII